MAAFWDKIKNLFQRKKTPNYSVEDGVEYRLFKILKGKYEGVVYFYTDTKFIEEGEGGVISFHVEFIDTGGYDPVVLIKDQDFVTMAGDILIDAFSNSLKGPK